MHYANDATVYASASASVGSPDSYNGGHALAPILIGLSAPALMLMFVAPDLLGGGGLRGILSVYLFVLMTFALGIFCISVIYPGPVVGADFEAKTGMAKIIRAGPLAHTVFDMPLDRIEKAELRLCYDDDGYSWTEPVLIMRSGDIINLPENTAEPQIRAINATLRSA